jgi:hypothetical protein
MGPHRVFTVGDLRKSLPLTFLIKIADAHTSFIGKFLALPLILEAAQVAPPSSSRRPAPAPRINFITDSHYYFS